MRKIIDTPRFKREYKAFVRNNSNLEKRIRETIRLMKEDVFSPSLHTHKLEGKLYGLRACSCGYDCRIAFAMRNVDGEEVIALYSIGTHDQVY